MQLGTSVVIDTPAVAAFLSGYRSVRILPDTDLAWLPLFTAARAVILLMQLPGILDWDLSPADPPWLPGLRDKLLENAEWQRTLVLENAPRQ